MMVEKQATSLLLAAIPFENHSSRSSPHSRRLAIDRPIGSYVPLQSNALRFAFRLPLFIVSIHIWALGLSP